MPASFGYNKENLGSRVGFHRMNRAGSRGNSEKISGKRETVRF